MTDVLPLVSIVIPSYNAGHYLGAAIDSVLQQTYPRIEVIVVDDGSTDETAARLAACLHRVVFIRQPHRGIGAARNAGIGRSTGDLLGFLDADDLFVSDKISRQVAALRDDPQLDAVFGHVEEFFDGHAEASGARPHVRPGAHPAYMAQTMVVRRETFDRVGLFEGWRVAEFMDWYLRAVDAGLSARMLDEVVTRRRIHATNVGVVNRGARVDFARVIKAALDRRRGGPNASRERGP
jgi:glycosyltransferase involved in cell wall biosynthesis